ncbi:hypothetical protein SAMD00024442_27_12 [Candidatus Symbiothrix dinenymphae]|nr:hypothetical protein SAMD00024442_27_12 [Candidatus Symbiothrix dinenymphae]
MDRKNLLRLCVGTALLLAGTPTVQAGTWTSGGITAVLSADSTLTISGSGAIDITNPWLVSKDSIKTVTIGTDVTSIGEGAFNACSHLKTVNFNATNCATMGSAEYPVFNACAALTTINIGSNVTRIPDYMFFDCSGLVSINVAGGNAHYSSVGGVLYNYAQTALLQCPKNKQGAVSIPAGVSSIGNAAFAGCIGLSSITNPNSVPQTVTANEFSGTPITTITLYVPAAGLHAYRNADVWKDFGDIYGLGNCTVTFDSQNGSPVASQSLLPDNAATRPADPTRSSYTFGGWYKEANCTTEWIFETDLVDGDMTLYAKWIPLTYNIAYNLLNGATNSNPTSYTPEDAITLVSPGAREGYIFAGWYANAGRTGSAVTSIATGSSGDTAFWAKWTLAFTITYNTDGGSGATDSTYTMPHGVITLPPAAGMTKTGYTFGGWYANEQLTGDAVTAIPADATGNKTFRAKWLPITYNITYETNGGSGATNRTYTIENHIILPAADEMTKVAHTFVGWHDNSELSGDTIFVFQSGNTGDKTFWAQWTESTAITPVAVAPLKIYPNPTSDVVHITNGNGMEVKVYNLSGELLQRTNENSIDLSAEPNGIYLLQVGKQTVKVVKK